ARNEQRVPQADVINVNPTHNAVAIKNEEATAKAPFVISKGVDSKAQRIPHVAKHQDNKVMSIPQLTPAKENTTQVDQEVPAGRYTAVANVF
ncbi:EscU/YscU/HrcU family type III secretion system export apparatus switch protein, partial [Aeromonas veronii]|uniref:EscU/YscU/HrcU family type III secretion system export apparatus switch protein n=1 Tax=Aeromonas veronii TaxID=654 RepID=UPI0038B63031